MSYVLGLGDEEAPPDCGGGDVMRLPKVGGGYAWGCVQDPTTGTPLKFTGAGAATVPVGPAPTLPALGYVLNLVNGGYSLDQKEAQVLAAAASTGLVVKDASGKWGYVSAAPAPTVAAAPLLAAPAPTTKSSLITLAVIGVGALGLWWLLK